jgi:hypothetical protein
MGRRKTPPTNLSRLRALLATGLGHVLVRITVASLVFLLAGIVMRQARAYTYRLEEFRVKPDSLAFVRLPGWADARVRRALSPDMFEPLSVSIYDPDAESLVRARVARHPMVHGVRSVRLLYPDRAEVEPVLRAPVAQVAVWVRGRDGRQVMRWRLLTDDGCLLPKGPYRGYLAALPFELPVVVGIRERAPRDAGEVWEDRTGRVQEAVAAAEMAARLHRDLSGYLTVTRIDVSRFPASREERALGEVRLTATTPPRAAGGARVERTIEWGRTERVPRDVEDPYPRKLERLIRALKTGERRIDVRWSPADRTTP